MKCCVLFVVCVVFMFVSSDGASQTPASSKLKSQPKVYEWEMQAQSMHDLEKMIEDDLQSRGGHGHTGQRSMEKCPSMCTFDVRPVCGSDGETYDNKCLLALTACREEKRIYIEKEGKC